MKLFDRLASHVSHPHVPFRCDPRYSDRSPLESYHLAETFAVLQQHNFTQRLSKEQRTKFRHLVVELVLGTDM